MSNDLRDLAARLLAASPHAMRMDEAQAQIAERRRTLLAATAPPSEADSEAANFDPQPLILDPAAFAAEFWEKRRRRETKDSSKPKRPGRKPVGNLDARHERFRVISGKDGGDNEDNGAI